MVVGRSPVVADKMLDIAVGNVVADNLQAADRQPVVAFAVA